MTARLTPELGELRGRHVRGDWAEEGWSENSTDGLECLCWEKWPCPYAALLDRVEALERVRAAAEKLRDNGYTGFNRDRMNRALDDAAEAGGAE